MIGKKAVASAAPRIQPLALSTATRKSLTARKPLCDDLRKYAGEASGAGDVEPQDLQRIKPRTVLTFVALALMFYILIPQLADVSGACSRSCGTPTGAGRRGPCSPRSLTYSPRRWG